MMERIADRQGDVILVHRPDLDAAKELPAHPKSSKDKKRGRLVLAEGEVTGHAHTLPAEVAELLHPRAFQAGHSLLVMKEETVQRGSFIEGKVLEVMPGGTIRFQQTDGCVIRFAPGDITVMDAGVKVKRAYTPLIHDEHDAIPVSKGVYQVIQHQTADVAARRRLVED